MGLFCSEPLNRGERLQRYHTLLDNLTRLRSEWELVESHPEPAKILGDGRRERLKILEAEISLLRLRQSESRLRQQLLIGLLGTGIGSGLTLLAQMFVK